MEATKWWKAFTVDESYVVKFIRSWGANIVIRLCYLGPAWRRLLAYSQFCSSFRLLPNFNVQEQLMTNYIRIAVLTQGFRSRYMVVSFSRELAKADSIPSSDGIWLSFNHKSSNLHGQWGWYRKESEPIFWLCCLLFFFFVSEGEKQSAKCKQCYLLKVSTSSIAVSLLDETSKTRRFCKVERPSIFCIPLWLRYSSSSAIHSWIREQWTGYQVALHKKIRGCEKVMSQYL